MCVELRGNDVTKSIEFHPSCGAITVYIERESFETFLLRSTLIIKHQIQHLISLISQQNLY